jgi:uncharacterized protein YcnI
VRRGGVAGPRRALLVSLLGAVALAVGLPGRVLAHVEVVPVDSPPGVMQRYAIRVPTEKPVPTVRVEIEFPSGLPVLDLEVSPGWQVTVQTESSGRLIGAVWEGGSIPAGQFAEFGLRAQNPEREAQLRWSVIQTYADGTEVQWIGPPNAEFPAAITRVSGRQLIDLRDPLIGASVLLALIALIVAGLAWRATRR